MTRVEYLKWVEESIDFGDDVDLDAEAEKAKAKFEELTANKTVEVVIHDWKCFSEHFQEVLDTANRMKTHYIEHFSAFWKFPHGQLDELVTVVSREPVGRELAEILADLTVNLGA